MNAPNVDPSAYQRMFMSLSWLAENRGRLGEFGASFLEWRSEWVGRLLEGRGGYKEPQARRRSHRAALRRAEQLGLRVIPGRRLAGEVRP